MRANFDHYHLIGIGGIGMSALARILLQRGAVVSGSDRLEGPLTAKLRALGAQVTTPHSAAPLAALDPKRTCIAYSTSIPVDNPELIWAKERAANLAHRGELLAWLAEEKATFGVTGSHGKTTTSALLAHLLEQERGGVSFALGGLVQPLNTNGHWVKGDAFVVEIDESDGKSFALPLKGGILTNFSHEHLDFWGSPARLFDAFGHWAHKVDPNLFVWCADDPHCHQIARGRGWGYGRSQTAAFRLQNVCAKGACMLFDVALPNGGVLANLTLPLRGEHNALNACGAIALCHLMGVSGAALRAALLGFQGVARRCQLRKTWQVGDASISIFDDYAHHPNEVRATLQGLRATSKASLIAIFQPHRYSRLRSSFEEYLTAFDAADEVWICPLYAAGEAYQPDFDSAALVAALKRRGVNCARFWSLESWNAARRERWSHEVIICAMGAGDVMEVTANLAWSR